MPVIAIVAALLVGQWRPPEERESALELLSGLAERLERSFDGGEPSQGALAWLIGVVPAAAAAIGLYALLHAVHPVLALLFDVGVLYVALGFRPIGLRFARLRAAMREEDLGAARELVDSGQPVSGRAAGREEIAQAAVEAGLLAAYRDVFGVLFWYVLLPGPTGAVLYRIAALLGERWRGRPFGRLAARALYVLDWPVARLTAAGFALVGNFEDAVYCWRTQAPAWKDPNAGIVLAAGAGALGVRLAVPPEEPEAVERRPEIGVGEAADEDSLDATLGLVWRALIAWLLALSLLALAAAAT